MRRDLDQPRKSGPGDRLDPTRARPEPWFVGSGRGLMVAVLLVCAVLIVLRIASFAMLAEQAWRWWTAPRPVLVANAPPPAPLPRREVPPIDPTRRSTPLKGDPRTAFNADDYPAAALRAEEQGRTVARLFVDASGTPTACTIVHSSGSRSLDQATCRVAVARVRYEPARDERGVPIPAETMLPVRWALPSN